MNIQLSSEAKAVLHELVDYVEHKNTVGAGLRFKKRFIQKLKENLVHVSHLDCKHSRLKYFGLKCFFINDWIIGYKIQDSAIVIFVIIHKSLLP